MTIHFIAQAYCNIFCRLTWHVGFKHRLILNRDQWWGQVYVRVCLVCQSGGGGRG